MDYFGTNLPRSREIYAKTCKASDIMLLFDIDIYSALQVRQGIRRLPLLRDMFAVSIVQSQAKKLYSRHFAGKEET